MNFKRAKNNLKNHKEKILNSYEKKYTIPDRLYIECTNLCNARCSFCYYKNLIKTPNFNKKFLSLESFQKIINQFIDMGGTKIALTPTIADPLTDPFFKERFEFLATTNIKQIDFYTNLISFNKKIQEAIKNCNKKLNITVSFTGFNKEKYIKFMGVDKFTTVKINLIKLQKLTFNKKNIIYKTLMRSYADDKVEKKDFISWCKTHNINYLISDLGFDTWGGLLEQELIEQQELKVKYRFERVGPCAISYSKPVVSVDGDFKLCDCRDVFGDLVVGNIHKQTIKEIWNSKKIKDMRNKFFKPETLPEVCIKCEGYKSIYDQ